MTFFNKKKKENVKTPDYASASVDDLHKHTSKLLGKFKKSGSKDDYAALDHHLIRAYDRMETLHHGEMDDHYSTHDRKVRKISGDTPMGPEHKNYKAYKKEYDTHTDHMINVRKRQANDHEKMKQAHVDTISHLKRGDHKLDHIEKHNLMHHDVVRNIAKNVAASGTDKQRSRFNAMYGTPGPRPIDPPKPSFFGGLFHREDFGTYLKGPATDKQRSHKSGHGSVVDKGNVHRKAGKKIAGNVSGKVSPRGDLTHSKAKAKQAAGN